MRMFSLLAATTLIAMVLGVAVGDEPSKSSFRFTLRPSKGELVLYPVAPDLAVAEDREIIISCDSLRFESKGHILVTNATIETKYGKLVSVGELTLDLNKPLEINVSGDAMHHIKMVKTKPQEEQQK